MSKGQDFEARVVARLIALSRERQVIVFTHRLSFLVLLIEETGSKSEPVMIGSRIQLKKIFLRQFGEKISLVPEAQIRESKVPQALNAFMARLEQAKKFKLLSY